MLDWLVRLLAVVAAALMVCIVVALLCRPGTQVATTETPDRAPANAEPANSETESQALHESPDDRAAAQPASQSEPETSPDVPDRNIPEPPRPGLQAGVAKADSPLHVDRASDPTKTAVDAIDERGPLDSERRSEEPESGPTLVVTESKRSDPEMRQWTYKTGETFPGKLLWFRNNRVVIQAPDGSVMNVHPSALSALDRQWYASVLKARRVAKGDERRQSVREARAQRAPRVASRGPMIPRTQSYSRFNQLNYGFPAVNYLPGRSNYNRMGNYFGNGSYYFVPYFYGFGYRGPQYIRHIHIENDEPAPVQSQQ